MITVVDVDVVDVDVLFLSWADLLYTVFMCVYVRASMYVLVDVAVHVSTSAL